MQKLEKMVLEMVASYEDCTAMAQAIKAVPGVYQPSDQVGVLLPSELTQYMPFVGAIYV